MGLTATIAPRHRRRVIYGKYVTENTAWHRRHDLGDAYYRNHRALTPAKCAAQPQVLRF
jgi:hypothetical protein